MRENSRLRWLLSAQIAKCRSGFHWLEVVRLTVVSAATAGQAHDQMDDGAYDKEDNEENEESAYSINHVIKFHDAGSGETLTELNGEGQHKDDRQDI